jgi:ribosomal protein S15P/S13E
MQQPENTGAFVIKIQGKDGYPQDAQLLLVQQGTVHEHQNQEEKDKKSACKKQGRFPVVN